MRTRFNRRVASLVALGMTVTTLEIASAASSRVRIGGRGVAEGAVSAVVSTDGSRVYVLNSSGTLLTVKVNTGEVGRIGIRRVKMPRRIFVSPKGLFVVGGGSLLHVDPEASVASVSRGGGILEVPEALRHAVWCDGNLFFGRSSGQLGVCSPFSANPSVLNATMYCTRNQSLIERCVNWGASYVRGARHMACLGGELAAIQMGGTLRLLPVAEQDPLKLRWRKVGETPAWKDVLAAVGRGRYLFTAEKDGALWKTDMDGNRTKVIAKGFAKTKFLLAAGPVKLVIIDADGNIYVVEV